MNESSGPGGVPPGYEQVAAGMWRSGKHVILVRPDWKPLSPNFRASHESDLEDLRPVNRGIIKARNMGVGRTIGSRDDWGTPEHIFAPYRDRVTLDVCASPENALCSRYFTKEQDGLAREWDGVWWMNPPFGRTVLPRWIEKAHEQAQKGNWGWAFLPAYTANAWWHEIVMPHYPYEFIRKRVRYVGAPYGAMFASVIVTFAPTPREPSL